jgi:hypothetical protein
MKSETEGGIILAVIIFAMIAILLAPLILIWSLNTLFGLTIAYGFFEWLAGLFLLGFFKQTPVNIEKKL